MSSAHESASGTPQAAKINTLHCRVECWGPSHRQASPHWGSARLLGRGIVATVRNWNEVRTLLLFAGMFSGVILVPLGLGLTFAGLQTAGLAIAVVGAVARPLTSWWVRNRARA